MIWNWIQTLLKNDSVVAAAKTLGKAVLTAALATLGINWLSGCSFFGTGVGVTL